MFVLPAGGGGTIIGGFVTWVGVAVFVAGDGVRAAVVVAGAVVWVAGVVGSLVATAVVVVEEAWVAVEA